MWELEKSLQQHGIEISGWILPPPGDPWDIGMNQDLSTLPIERRADGQAFLPYDLETSLELLAERKGHPLEAYQLATLCVAASLLPSQTRMVVDSFSGVEVPPILWGGLVGDPGSCEIFIINTLTLPLQSLQEKHNILYPFDYTARAVDRILVQQPERGLLVWPNDLTLFLQSMKSGRGSRGSEHSRWISLYDGNELTVGSRAVGRAFVQHPSVSVISRIEPSDIRQYWSVGKSYNDDIWACFAWVRVRFAPCPGTHDRPSYSPRGMLENIYRQLLAFLPSQYVLSRVGQQLWREWVEKIDDLICNEPNEKIRIALSKTKERAARVALVLHCLDAAYVHIQPGSIVPADTLARAIQFVYRLYGQANLIRNEMWGSDSRRSEE